LSNSNTLTKRGVTAVCASPTTPSTNTNINVKQAILLTATSLAKKPLPAAFPYYESPLDTLLTSHAAQSLVEDFSSIGSLGEEVNTFTSCHRE